MSPRRIFEPRIPPSFFATDSGFPSGASGPELGAVGGEGSAGEFEFKDEDKADADDVIELDGNTIESFPGPMIRKKGVTFNASPQTRKEQWLSILIIERGCFPSRHLRSKT